MPISDLSSDIQYSMDLLGIIAFALSGAFVAVRKDFDLFGTFIMSWTAGLGGGLFRDVVLDVTPVAFTDLGFFFAPAIAAVAVHFGHRLYYDHKVARSKLFDVCDAAALGIFSVTGTIKALDHGFNIPAAAALGCSSAVGGGVLASLLALEVPPLLRWDRDLYTLPVLVGTGLTNALYFTGLLNIATAVSTAGLALLLRLLALRYQWRTPRSYFWRNPFSGMRQQTPTGPAPHKTQPALEADTVTLSETEVRTLRLLLQRDSERVSSNG